MVDLVPPAAPDFCCRVCVFFVAAPGNVGQCRRHSPVHGPSPSASSWPVVWDGWWCGDLTISKKEDSKNG